MEVLQEQLKLVKQLSPYPLIGTSISPNQDLSMFYLRLNISRLDLMRPN